MNELQEMASMAKISVKIELRIGDAVHLLTMGELRELKKVVDGLVHNPGEGASPYLDKWKDSKPATPIYPYPQYPTTPPLYPGTGYPPWITYLTKTGDVIPDPFKVTC